MTENLFGKRDEAPTDGDIPDTLERRITTFLRRWSWKTDCPPNVRRELDELIAWAKEQA